MNFLFLVMAQATSSAPAEKIALASAPQCEAERSAKDEIIVCARRDGPSPYRINQPSAGKRKVPKAEVQIAKRVSAGVESEQAAVGGFPANRVMLRLKIKF